MSVLIFAENSNGIFKKSVFEAISYGVTIAKQLQISANTIVLGEIQNGQIDELAKYGVDQIFHTNDPKLNSVDAQAYAKAIAEVANNSKASVVIIANTYTGKAVSPRVAVRLSAGFVSGAVALPEINGSFEVKKTVFSNKGFADIHIDAPVKVIALTPNSYMVNEQQNNSKVEAINLAEPIRIQTKIVETKTVSGKIPLTEAERVVSAGRGLKGPENWKMIEEMADHLKAATACSKPVSDMDWRPHSEHVGQTGITIKPNLYIAIGISGAIQHLAGVSGSKVIVAINTDKEAPFFKIADYGIIGDAFDVVPKLNAALAKFKAAN